MTTKPVVIKFFAPVTDVTINALMKAIDQKMKEGITQFILLISSPGGDVFDSKSIVIIGATDVKLKLGRCKRYATGNYQYKKNPYQIFHNFHLFFSHLNYRRSISINLYSVSH